MVKFQIVLSPPAVKDLASLSNSVCKKIVRALRTLEDNPFPRGKLVKKIKGTNLDYYRLRIDAYRVFYMIEVTHVIVLRVLNKKDTARFIRKLD